MCPVKDQLAGGRWRKLFYHSVISIPMRELPWQSAMKRQQMATKECSLKRLLSVVEDNELPQHTAYACRHLRRGKANRDKLWGTGVGVKHKYTFAFSIKDVFYCSKQLPQPTKLWQMKWLIQCAVMGTGNYKVMNMYNCQYSPSITISKSIRQLRRRERMIPYPAVAAWRSKL